MRSCSLDALCSRYGIDRSHRIKHGALLDAELLAQLYIELTGGRQIGLTLVADQEAAAVESRTILVGAVASRPVRPPRFFAPSEAEVARHRAFVAKLNNALWLEVTEQG